MFDVEKFIDAVQDGKKQITETALKQTGLVDPINQIIDAQTTYTKTMVNGMSKMIKNLAESAGQTSSSMQAGLTDINDQWSKFINSIGWTTGSAKNK